MRMPAHELLGNATRNAVEIKTIILLRDLGMKDHLEEDIPEFLFKISIITCLDRGNRFVGFLDEIGDQRAV